MNIITAILDEREIAAEAERKELEKRMAEKNHGKRADGGMDVKASIFAESTYLLDGRVFRLRNRDYLKAIYDWPIENGLMMCGRQVEKSTTFSVKISNDALLRPFYRGLYFAPSNQQVGVFSEDRLGRLFTYSQNDIIKREYISKNDKQNVQNKSFEGVGSLIYLRAVYGNGDNIRGISANGVYGDEIQDIYVDALPVIGETQAHARDLGPGIKMTWYSGTPKTFSNTIQTLWDKSNQMEWVVRCLHCSQDQIMDLDNVTPTKYICKKCGKELTTLNIAKNARWVKMNRSSSTYGFRISQLTSPSMRASDIWTKMQTYPTSKVYNEVLGRSYENASKPMPKKLLRKLMDTDRPMMLNRQAPYLSTPMFMGVDWGHGTTSFTIVVIGYIDSAKNFVVVYSRKFETGDELNIDFQKIEIEKLMIAFQIAYFIGDYGDGFEQGQHFKGIYGQRFDMCYYSWNQGKLLDYNPKNGFWTVNRDKILYWYVEEVKKLKVRWPAYDEKEIKHLLEDHSVIQVEYRSSETKSPDGNVAQQRSNDMMFTHPQGSPDDSFHASFYCWMAARLFHGIPIDPLSSTSWPVQFSGAMTTPAGTVL